MEAVLEQPLFSPDHKLILPEGTQVDGTVVVAKRAGWFHRGGRLRFNFQNLELPEVAGLLASPHTSVPAETPAVPEEKKLQVRTQGTLAAAEGDKAPVKVDSEGGVQATESKTRFIGTAVACWWLARQATMIRYVLRQSEGGAGRSSARVKMLAVELSGAVWASDC